MKTTIALNSHFVLLIKLKSRKMMYTCSFGVVAVAGEYVSYS